MDDSLASEMSLNEAKMYLKDHLGKEWRDVGRHLGLSDGDLDHINADNIANAKEINYQMLQKWISKNGRRANVSILADALRNSGRDDLANKLIKGKRPAAHLSETQVGSSANITNTKTRDAEERETYRTVRLVFYYFLVPAAVACVFYLVSINIAISNGNHGVNTQKTHRAETNKLKDDITEADQLEKAIMDVKNTLTKEWQDVGRFLGIPNPEIEHIKEEFDNNPKERNYQMFQKWRKQYGKLATLEVLEEALQKAGRQDLVDNLH